MKRCHALKPLLLWDSLIPRHKGFLNASWKPVQLGETIQLPCSLPCLEGKYSKFVNVEVDEVLCLMGHVGSEVPLNDAMPKRCMTSVQLLLDEVGDVLLCVESVHGSLRQLYHFILENIVHVRIFDLDLVGSNLT